MTKKVALICFYEHVSVANPVMNTAKFLASKGFYVDIYMLESKRFNYPKFDNKNINVIITRVVFNYYLIRNIEIAFQYLRYSKKYLFIIGYNPDGLIRAGIINIIWKIPFIYHNFDLFLINKGDSWGTRLKKVLERWFSKRALFVLTQDLTRAEIIAKDNGIPIEKVLVSYNSTIGHIMPSKKNYLRDKFNISKEKIIVLAVGYLVKEQSIDKIVRFADQWPDQFVLVIHGWFSNDKDFENMIRKEAEHKRGKVFISTDILDYNNKYDVFQSADIGLVFFEPINVDLLYAAGTAGKLYDFMKTGVPIIANELPNMRELVEKNNIGIVIKDASEIKNGLPFVMNNYTVLRKNALNTYYMYDFTKNYEEILNKVLHSISAAAR